MDKYTQRNTDRLSQLVPAFGHRADQLLGEMRDRGHPMVIVEGLRSRERQARLYAKGRTKPGPIVTNAPAGYSWHNFGLAVDCAFLVSSKRRRSGDFHTGMKISWEGPWELYGQVAQSIGLTWGGTFRSINDSPHVEWHAGITLRDARTESKRWERFVRRTRTPTALNQVLGKTDAIKVVVNDSLAAEGINRNGRIYAPVSDVIEAVCEALDVHPTVAWNGQQQKVYVYLTWEGERG